jgi:hypothetical protein
MKNYTKEVADWSAKITIRLEGFPDKETARQYLQGLLSAAIAPERLTDASIQDDAGDLVFTDIVCHGSDPDGTTWTKHCQGTGICV